MADDTVQASDQPSGTITAEPRKSIDMLRRPKPQVEAKPRSGLLRLLCGCLCPKEESRKEIVHFAPPYTEGEEAATSTTGRRPSS